MGFILLLTTHAGVEAKQVSTPGFSRRQASSLLKNSDSALRTVAP